MSLQKIEINWALRPQKASLNITDADLTDADTSQTFPFALALPTNAVIISRWIDVAETIEKAATATAASKVGGAETYNLAAGDTAVIDVDDVGNATATWDAAAGTQQDNSFYPLGDQDGNSFTVTIDGGSSQPVTFSGATTTAAHVRDAINAQTTGCAATLASVDKAAVKTGGAETYLLSPGDTIVLDVDDVGNATATWDAAAATITDNTVYPVADQNGLTSLITIDGGTQQTVTFSGATTTAQNVVDQMNAQLVGCSVAVDGGQVKITSDVKGTNSTVAAAAGTGGLTWDAPVAGTGDVATIVAVTAAEVKTVIEADTTATVDATGGTIVISSPTTGAGSELDFISGNALTPLGLSVETIVGTTSQVLVTSDTAGTGSSVAITAGDTDIIWSAASAGTGDVVNIDAVTAAEVKTVIEADTTATVTLNGGGTFTILSPTTGASSELDFISGNALTPLGLSVETVTGSAGTAGTATADFAGDSTGDADALIDGGDLSTAVGKVNGPDGVASTGHYGGKIPAVKIDSTINLNLFAQGDITANILYIDTTKLL
jgi:hypothetical protein